MAEVQGDAPWFWKIFGGTLLGMITLLLITIFGNLRTETSDIKRDILIQINELRADIRQERENVGSIKDRLISIEQVYSKEKLQNIDKSVVAQTEKIVALEAVNVTIKDDAKIIRDELKDLTKQTQEVREKVAALTPIVSEKKPTTDKP